jgi:beta-mannanase
VILEYVHFADEFPTRFMQRCYDEGRVVELTYQVTETNNLQLFGYTPFLDVYRGKMDDRIREFARRAKEFGHPFLFRMNNEVNSDWTSYSGVVNMSDPDIFVENWRRVYRIFEEEGVNNAIWIFNPNDDSYPPALWNHFSAYVPGAEYVQMIGLTGYNTGTFVSYERWREFEDIYDKVEGRYYSMYGAFPWIITEFASSSVGGDKVAWIDSMFAVMPKYKNIKIAVWFDYADFEYALGDDGERVSIPKRPYWLAETPETEAAFKRGLADYK